MKRFNPYIDFEDGSGFVAADFYDVKLLFNKKRDFNPIIQRDYLEGSCQVIGDQAEKVRTAFVTNSKFKLNMKVYEWGTDITGTLIWEGAAFIISKFDLNRNFVEFKEFETHDIYTPWLPYFTKNIVWDEMISPQDTGWSKLTSEGLEPSCSEIKTLNWDGTNWTVIGTPFPVLRTGKPVISSHTLDKIAIYDNVTETITRYTTADNGLNWAASSLGTRLAIANAGAAALDTRNASSFAYIDDENLQFRTYQAILGSWSVTGTSNYLKELKKPVLTFLYTGANEIYAFADEASKSLSEVTYGATPIVSKTTDLGDVENIDMAFLSSDGAIHEIAIVDGKTQKLRAYKFDIATSTKWFQIGSGLYLGDVKEPSVVFIQANEVAVHDSHTGVLQSYQWDGSIWTKLGNSISIQRGFYSSLAQFQTNRFALIIGDAIENETRYAFNTEGVVNSIIWKLSGGDLDFGMDYRLSNDTFTSNETFWGFLSSVLDLYSGTDNASDKINIKGFLKIIEEMFQNYWYISEESSLSPRSFIYQLKFTQPDQFSSFGITVDVSAKTGNLNIREYLETVLTDREDINFRNALNSDFIGEDILYGRETGKNIVSTIPITTDWERVNKDLRGNDDKFERSGMYAVFTEYDLDLGAGGKRVIKAGTGILSGSSERNELLSKSRLQDTYMKTYRYANDINQNININGVNVPVSGTCKPVISFPEVSGYLENYPGAISELDWGGGVKSYVIEARTDWITGSTVFSSVLLDL